MRYDWPQDLKLDREARLALETIGEQHPLWVEWPEGESFRESPQAQATAECLIPTFHPELAPLTIKYLFQENMGNAMRVVFGKAMKAPGRWNFLSGVDFVLTFNWTIWKELSAPQRAALVDHELEHCFVEEVEDGGHRLVMHPHDLEEFNVTVRRWGLWRSNVANFLDAARPQMEMELGTATAPATE